MTDNQKILIVSIAYFAGRGMIFKGQQVKEIADKAGVSIRTVYRAIRVVNETKLITMD